MRGMKTFASKRLKLKNSYSVFSGVVEVTGTQKFISDNYRQLN